jgi:hypothetical protein
MALERDHAPRHHRVMARRAALVLILCTIAASCSLFHSETPQQKLFDALNRGNGLEANQLWQNMSEKDRLKFSRGEGITPAVPPQQVVKMITQMQPEDMQGQITIRPPENSGTLLDLPSVAQPQPAQEPQEPGQEQLSP